MANRVVPSSDSPLPPASKTLPPLTLKTLPPSASTVLPSSAPSPLDLLKSYVDSKLCYHSSALTNAKVTNVDKSRVAYQIDLWSLVESRERKFREKPYNNETAPGNAVLNAWDYDFPRPSTVLQKKQKVVHELTQTQKKITCPTCKGAGEEICYSCKGRCGTRCRSCNRNSILRMNDDSMYYRPHCSRCNNTGVVQCSTCSNTGRLRCTRCETRGSLLTWYQLTIQWYTIHSLAYQSNTPLPFKLIKKTPGKVVYRSYDEKWSAGHSFVNYFQNVFNNQQTSWPVKLNEINEEFNKKHLKKVKKTTQIVQLKLEVQKLSITEIEYEIEEFNNKRDANMGHKFRFYHYGTGKKNESLIYENDYPLNTCGCFGVGCAHYSKCCSISLRRRTTTTLRTIILKLSRDKTIN